MDNILHVFSYILTLLFLFSYFDVIIEKDNFLWWIFLEFFVSKIWITNILNFQVKKDTFVKKESDFYPKRKKNACYNLIIVIVFDQEVVILPMNSHLLWFDWQVKELTDILVKSQTKFKTTSHFKCQKEEN